jgi:hypothetical protein
MMVFSRFSGCMWQFFVCLCMLLSPSRSQSCVLGVVSLGIVVVVPLSHKRPNVVVFLSLQVAASGQRSRLYSKKRPITTDFPFVVCMTLLRSYLCMSSMASISYSPDAFLSHFPPGPMRCQFNPVGFSAPLFYFYDASRVSQIGTPIWIPNRTACL